MPALIVVAPCSAFWPASDSMPAPSSLVTATLAPAVTHGAVKTVGVVPPLGSGKETVCSGVGVAYNACKCRGLIKLLYRKVEVPAVKE